MTLFEEVDILNKKTRYPTSDEIKSGSQWMLNRMFSCSPTFYPLAVEMNMYSTLDNKLHFDCYYFGIPKNKNFIQYNAKKAKTDQLILMIAEFYNCNENIAKDYLELLTKEEIKTVEDYFNKRGRMK